MPPVSRCAVTRLIEFSSPRRMVNISPALPFALRGDRHSVDEPGRLYGVLARDCW